ncbi:MAG: lysophospholipid acyltransferase family protein [Patescibacteria group bacterium]|nr:lysophospholipid acyltransferase family protein [Patescibacteria group bacterium]MDD4303895.1 lysophospholipid acyltransferase family protein [Patescibacteria group bacterium]
MINHVRIAFIFIWTFIMSLVAGLCLVFGGKNRGPRWYNFCGKVWSWVIIHFCCIKLRVYGIEKIKDLKNVIFTPNHMSHFDILFLYLAISGQIRFVFKQELGEIPVFGWVLRRSGNITVDREHLKSSTIKNVVATLELGNNIVMFPEGTRSFDGNLREFKEGPFVLGYMSKAQIVPVTINGSFCIHNKINPNIVNSGFVNVIIHDPISCASSKQNPSKDERKLAIELLRKDAFGAIKKDYIVQKV